MSQRRLFDAYILAVIEALADGSADSVVQMMVVIVLTAISIVLAAYFNLKKHFISSRVEANACRLMNYRAEWVRQITEARLEGGLAENRELAPEDFSIQAAEHTDLACAMAPHIFFISTDKTY